MKKSQAIEILNQWGSNHIPFLFIIDFEMEAIRLFRLDSPLPDNIKYCFHSNSLSVSENSNTSDFRFDRYPVSYKTYEQSFLEVRKQIIAGNTFLLNLTFPTIIETNLSLTEIFYRSIAKYKLLADGEFVCFSPETFIKITDGVISTFPMKGTINSSIPEAEDIILNSMKEKAEHNTVVDLLRNDLSITASEVTVKKFRYIDRLQTNKGELLQVSSEISGNLVPGYLGRLGDIIFSLLPAGSVTGAPKSKTIEIIRSVEKHERGYYTGVCGIFDGKNLDSAVMIRFIEIVNGRMRFRSGGGITSQSIVTDEYNELIDKVYVPFT